MHISDEQLRTIRQTIGEAFVSNELFHNWGNVDEHFSDYNSNIYREYPDDANGLTHVSAIFKESTGLEANKLKD